MFYMLVAKSRFIGILEKKFTTDILELNISERFSPLSFHQHTSPILDQPHCQPNSKPDILSFIPLFFTYREMLVILENHTVQNYHM